MDLRHPINVLCYSDCTLNHCEDKYWVSRFVTIKVGDAGWQETWNQWLFAGSRAHAPDKETYFVNILPGDVKHLFVTSFLNDTPPPGGGEAFPWRPQFSTKTTYIYIVHVHYILYYPAKWHFRSPLLRFILKLSYYLHEWALTLKEFAK